MDKNNDAFEQSIHVQPLTNRPFYAVNNNAERILDSVATSCLVFGWILGAIYIITGIVAAIEYEVGGGLVAAGIVLGVAQIALGYLAWATLKVIVNISNNLYNINAGLNRHTNHKMDIDADKVISESPFTVGQLVIVKADESQFRINAIEVINGEVSYFSEKLNRYFIESEIEDFDKYWEAKKKN